MNRFTSYSGNGYAERQSMIQKNFVNRQTYAREQDKLRKLDEERKLNEINNNNISNSVDKIDAMRNVGIKQMPQNHLKFPGNNKFH